MAFDILSTKVIGCAIEVHRTLGPGLLESTYEQCQYFKKWYQTPCTFKKPFVNFMFFVVIKNNAT
jgi:hypothetical protein